jgi:CRISPR-associated protein Csd1
MIQELVQLAERNRAEEPEQWAVHDALCKERLDAYICIRSDGQFIEIIPTDKKKTVAEDLVRTENKGRTSNVLARLLLDNEKYLLGLPEGERSADCLKAYLDKLHQYEKVSVVKSVLNFYEKKKDQGLKAARKAFEAGLQSKQFKNGTNFSFLIRRKGSDDIVAHTDAELIHEIKERYGENERQLKGSCEDTCSVCGKSSYRVRNLATHGTIDGVLPRNTLGNYLISYEGDAFSSYGLKGNDNSLVCT